MANVVDHVVAVHARQDDVPEEPATDRQDAGDDGRDAVVVRFQDLQLCDDDDDADGVGQITHGEETVVACEDHVTEEPEHGKVHDHCFTNSHEHPSYEDLKVEPFATLSSGVELRCCD